MQTSLNITNERNKKMSQTEVPGDYDHRGDPFITLPELFVRSIEYFLCERLNFARRVRGSNH